MSQVITQIQLVETIEQLTEDGIITCYSFHTDCSYPHPIMVFLELLNAGGLKYETGKKFKLILEEIKD